MTGEGWRGQYVEKHGRTPELHGLILEFPFVEWGIVGEKPELYVTGGGLQATNQKAKSPGHAWALANATLANLCVRTVSSDLVVARYRERRCPGSSRAQVIEKFAIALNPEEWKEKNPPLFVVARRLTDGLEPVAGALYSHLHAAGSFLRATGVWCSDIWPPEEARRSALDFYLGAS